MSNKRKILILYTEIAGYTLACIREFNLRFGEFEIHLVRYPVNDEAPFIFRNEISFKEYDGKKMYGDQLLKLAYEIEPELILCSGWIDKKYTAVCRKFKNKIPVVLAMDNKWEGTLRQKVAGIISSLTVGKTFTHAWVPGNAQKKFAMKLGFQEKNIRTGFYSADTAFFNEIFSTSANEKKKKFPHKFIYAGRYYDFKGLKELWEAFIRFKKENNNDWELWCLGTGDLVPVKHDSIRHFGFVQPGEMGKIMSDAGVFILPSRIEPWCVAVQEFSAAGFPLLLSNKVGAAETFLEENKNGFMFLSENVQEIVRAIKKIAEMKDEQLFTMGERSHEFAQRITPASWAKTLHSFLINFNKK
ncbi:MAG: glycosyltransferase family 4 protein [Bacteroidetes bacterium]|nr:glycosyltransferase family 4 protein [Bacteroidota bacterium]